jgi:hypothetical protein
MMLLLVGWSIGQLAIAVIIIAAIIAIVFIVTKNMGIAIPNWVAQVFWVLVLAVVGVLAVKFLLGL